jgi:hypothetical protein
LDDIILKRGGLFMADIDFITDMTDGDYKISLGDNPTMVGGNRALVNRFEITFMTKTKIFLLGDTPVVDRYGGNAERFIGKPHILNDLQSIGAAISTAVDQTVESMKSDDGYGFNTGLRPDTEKIVSAEVLSVDVISDRVFATIKINPVVTESFNDLIMNLPITKV